jgi:hypothetical protein
MPVHSRKPVRRAVCRPFRLASTNIQPLTGQLKVENGWRRKKIEKKMK